jgi:hypothetical protein
LDTIYTTVDLVEAGLSWLILTLRFLRDLVRAVLDG